jgi:uncharacterized protein (TIGR03067 family)
MKKALLGVAVVGLLVAADDKKDDIKDKLKGTWEVVSMEVGGKKAPDEAFKGQTLTFEADKVISKGKDKPDPATYTIDATKKPAELDIVPTEGPQKGKTVKMIFQLDGDTLKIAGKMEPTERPKGFDDKDVVVMTLKRQKK